MPYGNNGGYQPRRQSGYNGGQQRPQAAQTDNISTTGTSFINEGYNKFMNVNFWGRCMSIEIGTCPPGQPMDWNARKNAQVSRQVITYSAIADLCEMLEEVRDSIKTTGKFTSVGVRCGSKNDVIIEISNGENLKLPSGIYLVVYKGVDNTNRTDQLEFYPFANTRFIRDYDHTTGGGREDMNKLGEFKKFRRVCEAASEAFTMAQAHAVAEVRKGEKLAVFKALSAIGAAMGVDMSKDLQETKTTGSAGYTRNQNPNPGRSNGYRQGGAGGYQKNTYSRQGGTFETPNPSQAFGQTPQQAAQLQAIVDQPVDLNMDLASLQNVTLSEFVSG